MRASVFGVALGLLLVPCSASATYLTLTSSGTLYSAADPANLFGTNNPDLDGQTYDLRLIFDESVASNFYNTGDVINGEPGEFSYTGGPNNGYPAAMWAWLTVAGRQVELTGDASIYGSYFPYRPYFNLTDNDVNGHRAALTINYFEEDFAIFDLSPQYVPVAYGNFSPETFSLTSTPGSYNPAGIPEPAAWAMMIGGFGAVGAMLRRRRAVGAGEALAACAA